MVVKENTADGISSAFKRLFGLEGTLFRAPGRINLIGEHTDYNEGFVLPGAIGREIYFALSLREDQEIHLHSYDFDDFYQGKVSALYRSEKGWADYIIGMVKILADHGYTTRGFNCVFGGNIPIGAGLSSSAALESGLGFALSELNEWHLDRLQLAQYGRLSENTFIGVNSGIMDEFAVLYGLENKVIRLDCRSLDYEYYPLNLTNITVALCKTHVGHSLAATEYNLRRKQCEQGVAIVQTLFPEVKSLRDVDEEMLEAVKPEMDRTIYFRCRHVVDENQRVIDACNYLQTGDITDFGLCMYGSHAGLQHLYEVSCPELDFLVDQTRENPIVLGSRMMGGGFGGCTINLVIESELEKFSQTMQEAYKQRFHVDLPIYVAKLVDGVSYL